MNVAAGRFAVEDTELALAVAGGALLGLGNLLWTEPERDDARAADAVTRKRLAHFWREFRRCARPMWANVARSFGAAGIRFGGLTAADHPRFSELD
jgi:hypothetical protein